MRPPGVPQAGAPAVGRSLAPPCLPWPRARDAPGSGIAEQKHAGRPAKRSRLALRSPAGGDVTEAAAAASASEPGIEPEDLVEHMLSQPGLEGDVRAQLRTQEAFWKALKEQPARRGPTIVRTRHRRLPQKPDFDVCVCGGSLGILLATTLQKRGFSVCVVERGLLQGRSQEWNANGHELQELVTHGAVSAAELADALVTQTPDMRVAFKGSEEFWLQGVLDAGVSPRRLLAAAKQNFLSAGGILKERTTFKSAEVFSDGVAIKVAGEGAGSSGGGGEVRARLLVDCMGHWGPIVRQLRGSRKPDGMCLVVGGCAAGVPAAQNRTGDFLRSITDAADDMQLFWEAFPAEAGAARTFYMFAYCDADRRRPSLKAMLATFFRLLPQYAGLPLAQLRFKRVLFAGLPSWSDGPLQPAFDRVIQVGDASASASPLSFGGFGSMVRHLGRMTQGLEAALRADALGRRQLRLLQPYQPSLSAAWLFQRAMGVKVGQMRGTKGRAKQPTGFLPPGHVNRLLGCNFGQMRRLGARVLRPFVQDKIRFWPLTLAMGAMALADPIVVLRVVRQVGPRVLLGWLLHYWALGAYTLLHALSRPLRRFSRGRFRVGAILDAWQFGAGQD